MQSLWSAIASWWWGLDTSFRLLITDGIFALYLALIGVTGWMVFRRLREGPAQPTLRSDARERRSRSTPSTRVGAGSAPENRSGQWTRALRPAQRRHY